MRSLHLPFLLLAATVPARAAQTLRGALIDAGGNAVQYAQFFLIGPSQVSFPPSVKPPVPVSLDE